MTGSSAVAIATVKALQVVLASLQTYLGWGTYLCPNSLPVDTIISNSPYQYIIVGAGEAGSVLANRLGETDASTLVLETGGCPPMESLMAGLFPALARSEYDWAYDAYNDGYSCQNQKHEGVITAGKMMGGSGALNHLMYVSPKKEDYVSWGEAADDYSWAFPDFAYYFAKGENVKDKGVLAQNSSWHGTDGPTLLTKEIRSSNEDTITAYVEMGLPYKNDSDGQCVVEPLLFIGKGMRQCGNVPHLRDVMSKTNVQFLTGATVTKIIIDDNTAKGVEFTHNGRNYSVFASSKIIVSAGAIKSPHLLMHSGIGDKDKLAGFGIKSVVNNKHVGQNLMDHTVAVAVIAMNNSTDSIPATDYAMWPAPMVTSYVALTPEDPSVTRQDIAILFPPSSSGLLQLCAHVFQYENEICDAWYDYNINRNVLFVIMNLLRPESRGCIEIQSANSTEDPIIKMKHLSNRSDLDLFAKHGLAFSKILETKSMKHRNAEFADIGVCTEYEKNSLEFWRCYILATSSTLWHFCGTCAMGTVLDASLNVIGVNGLKVVDASVMPSIVSCNIGATVRALAEKGADIIKNEDGLVNRCH